ncbi:unnamed protein product, partial [Pylaiella littoralis]
DNNYKLVTAEGFWICQPVCVCVCVCFFSAKHSSIGAVAPPTSASLERRNGSPMGNKLSHGSSSSSSSATNRSGSGNNTERVVVSRSVLAGVPSSFAVPAAPGYHDGGGGSNGQTRHPHRGENPPGDFQSHSARWPPTAGPSSGSV